MEWTNKEQSEKLMSLGINPGTADLTLKALVTDSRGTGINSPKWVMITMPFQDLVKDTPKGFEAYEYLPSWSPLKLFQLLPDMVSDGTYKYQLYMNHNYIYYKNTINVIPGNYCYFEINDNNYIEALLDIIEFLKARGNL